MSLERSVLSASAAERVQRNRVAQEPVDAVCCESLRGHRFPCQLNQPTQLLQFLTRLLVLTTIYISRIYKLYCRESINEEEIC